MTMCIFIGPTLRREEVAAVCDAVCLPPVAQGDVYRVMQRRPRAIGIVDGYFSGAPSVWHKEILWALAQGIHVFGSASMGALRAAELHSLGMRGVGRIFEAFRDGILEDDDEVAVVHGPAELGYLAASEPMVNIRATLARAETEGFLDTGSRRALESFAKSLFFPHRTWPAVLGGAHDVAEAELARLRSWLPQGRVDQKREDALAMLAAMRETLGRPEPHRPNFRFEWTQFWDDLVAQPGIDSGASDPSMHVPYQDILEELRLEGDDSYGRTKARALARLLARLAARREGLNVSPQATRATLARVRGAHGLFTRAELDAWLERNHLDAGSLEALIEDQARADALAGSWGPALERDLLDELRLAGTYERLAARARQKKQALATNDVADDGSAPSPAALRLWFFEQHLGRPVPDDLDGYLRDLGIESSADFDSALRREWLYLRIIK